jgi:PAS domain-containing protein
MKIQRFLRDALLVGLALLSLQAFQAFLLQGALKRQDQILVRRLGTTVAGPLNRAHKANDDISLYQMVNALAESPGVLVSCIVDPEGKIIVDPKPARLGRTLDTPPAGSPRSGFTLKDGAKPWGRLVLSLSDRYSRKLLRRQWLLGTMAAGLVWLILFLYWQVLERRTSGLRTQVHEFSGQLGEEKRKLAAAFEREQVAILQTSAYLKRAVDQAAGPLMVLDHHQRVLAVNPAALARLGIGGAAQILRKSWHEVPGLEACGAGLERSLAIPGQPIDCSASSGELRVVFETDLTGLAGTWVRF